MISLVDDWKRTGSPEYLYSDDTEKLITAMKSWVTRRKTFINNRIAECWDVLRTEDFLHQLEALHESNQETPTQAKWEEIANFTATQMKTLVLIHTFKNGIAKENILAEWFVASFRDRGGCWPQISCRKGLQADATVCACLGSVDTDFKTKAELEVLEDEAQASQWMDVYWMDVYRRRKQHLDIPVTAEYSAPGFRRHPTAIHPANRLRNTDATAGGNPATQNHVVYFGDTSGYISTNPNPPSSAAADTKQTATGPSKTQDRAEKEGRDKEAGKKSRSKKRREHRKRAKARDRKAAAKAEATVGNNHDGDKDGDVPNSVAQ